MNIELRIKNKNNYDNKFKFKNMNELQTYINSKYQFKENKENKEKRR